MKNEFVKTGGRMMRGKKSKKEIISTSILTFTICALITLVVCMEEKKEMDYFNAHDWVQVEAEWSSAWRYEERDSDDNMQEYYRWYYTYEMDGKEYKCEESEHSDNEPPYEPYTKTILVASDDHSIYLLYENEEQFKESKAFQKKMTPVLLGIIWLVIFIIPIIWYEIFKKSSYSL